MGMTSAEKQRAFRERARDAGLCIVCGKNDPRPGLTTCEPCDTAAKGRIYSARDRVKKQTRKKSKATKKRKAPNK